MAGMLQDPPFYTSSLLRVTYTSPGVLQYQAAA